jgi:hypothetical protein
VRGRRIRSCCCWLASLHMAVLIVCACLINGNVVETKQLENTDHGRRLVPQQEAEGKEGEQLEQHGQHTLPE